MFPYAYRFLIVILQNKEAIAVNQAWAGEPGRLVIDDPKYQLWSKRIAGTASKPTAVAAILFNRDGSTLATQSVKLASLGLSGTVSARDVWMHKDDPIVVSNGVWTVANLTQHDSAFFVFTSK
jgi:hypothetical protein